MRLMQMVHQNGGKFEGFLKLIKKSDFMQIEKFFRRSSSSDINFQMRKKKIRFGHFKIVVLGKSGFLGKRLMARRTLGGQPLA